MTIIDTSDLPGIPAETGQRLIDEALARASLVAPCLLDLARDLGEAVTHFKVTST